MSLLVAASKAPEIDYRGLSPVLALVGGAVPGADGRACSAAAWSSACWSRWWAPPRC